MTGALHRWVRHSLIMMITLNKKKVSCLLRTCEEWCLFCIFQGLVYFMTNSKIGIQDPCSVFWALYFRDLELELQGDFQRSRNIFGVSSGFHKCSSGLHPPQRSGHIINKQLFTQYLIPAD